MSSPEDLERAARTISILVGEGFTPKSASRFVKSGDPDDLRHTGMVSVQLYKTGDEHICRPGCSTYNKNLPRSAGGTPTRQVITWAESVV